jgi:hypothetical protein
VSGPSWVNADRVALYANGIKVRDETIRKEWRPTRSGVIWTGEWKLMKPKHDVHLVAIATGPGMTDLYWPIAKPYQPTENTVRKVVIGCTGAVWVDADGDGKRTSAFDYAKRIYKEVGGTWQKVVKALAGYDESVAAQAASLLRSDGVSLNEPEVRDAARRAGEQVARGFTAYWDEWRASQIARREKK